jgi:hypothetical protein
VTPWIRRKLAALLCHRSQVGADSPFTRLSDADAQRLLGTEQFRRARPHTGVALLEPLGTPRVSRRTSRMRPSS